MHRYLDIADRGQAREYSVGLVAQLAILIRLAMGGAHHTNPTHLGFAPSGCRLKVLMQRIAMTVLLNGFSPHRPPYRNTI